ncbi:hypothetical protein [Salana multivorans]
MAILPTDLPGVDNTVARRVIAVARSIAPCIDSLDGEPKQDAIAILLGVASEVPEPGTRHFRSQSRNGTSVTMADYQGAFTVEDRSALRALCGAASAAAVGAPVGSFPPSTITKCIWPPERH